MALTQVNMTLLEQSIKSNGSYDYEEMERKIAERDAKLAAFRRKEYEIRRLGGLVAYEEFTADKFDNKRILAALDKFPNENYFLWGPPGTGKTHAAVVALRKTEGEVFTMSRISRILRRCQNPDEEIDTIKKLSQVTMLLDDLGSEKMTEFLQSNFFEIIERRLQYRHNGLIITSNLNLKELAPIIGPRTVSRIMGLVGRNILKLSGKDRRAKI